MYNGKKQVGENIEFYASLLKPIAQMLLSKDEKAESNIFELHVPFSETRNRTWVYGYMVDGIFTFLRIEWNYCLCRATKGY